MNSPLSSPCVGEAVSPRDEFRVWRQKEGPKER